MSHAAVEPVNEAGDAARAAARGDREAYAQLVRTYHAPCLRFATRMLRDDVEAEDAVQDAFMRGFLAIARYDGRVPFRGWLFRILVNRCRTLATQRARRSRRFVPEEGAAAAAGAAEAPAPPDSDRTDAIRAAVDALDPLLREAFLLKYVEELEYSEMTEALGASVSALKMRVKRACEELRPRLQEIYDDR